MKTPKEWVKTHKNTEKGIETIKEIPTKYWNKHKKNKYKKDLKNMAKATGTLTLAFSVVGISFLLNHKKK